MRRLLPNTLMVLATAAILGGLTLYYADQRQATADLALAKSEVSRFQQQILLRAALAEADGPSTGSRPPESIDPKWFEGNRPVNPLLGPLYPWVEIEEPGHPGRMHPLNLTASDVGSAQFWYNPSNGIVRARVPLGISDAKTLQTWEHCRKQMRFRGQALAADKARAKLDHLVDAWPVGPGVLAILPWHKR